MQTDKSVKQEEMACEGESISTGTSDTFAKRLTRSPHQKKNKTKKRKEERTPTNKKNQ